MWKLFKDLFSYPKHNYDANYRRSMNVHYDDVCM